MKFAFMGKVGKAINSKSLTVDDVMAQFNKQIDELEAVRARMEEQEREQEQAIAQAQLLRNHAQAEKERATAVSGRIKALLGA